MGAGAERLLGAAGFAYVAGDASFACAGLPICSE